MLIIVLISLLYIEGNCYVIPIAAPTYSKELLKCVTDIVSEYFAKQKVLTYAECKENSNEFRQAIHNLNVVLSVSRSTFHKFPGLHDGYIILAKNYTALTERFPKICKEPAWNPEARILIIVRSLEDYQLKHIFNKLLKHHVVNVVILNATAEAHLYTYNAYDNYSCGKRYDEIISYGKCSQTHNQNLFPNKYVTEMRNCTLTIAMPHWPPYSLFPPNGTNTLSPLSYGIEPYLLQLVGKMEKFTLNIIPNQDNESNSTVSNNMEADEPLKMLYNNEVDAVLGGLLLTPSRAEVYDYIYEFLAYTDEIRFLVRQASFVPPWKDLYLEFDAWIWVLIGMSLICYSTIMIILLRVEDKSLIVFKLLDNLVLHNCNIHYESTAKFIFLIWVWFAYLINSFYQSSLVSLTTDPVLEDQISTEADILHHNLQPCFSEEMERYYLESTQSQYTYHPLPSCNGSIESVTTVMNSKDYYTIYLHGYFMYNRHLFFDKYGNSYIYSLKKPYSKVIYCMYFYKGFPLIDDIRLSALQLREMGLADKALFDINYINMIKHHYQSKEFESRFAIPWRLYILGCSMATITLIVEILSKYK